jgi:hypothetical protein
MKGIKKKKNYISVTNCHACIWFMSSKRKTLTFLFRARLTRMRQLLTNHKWCVIVYMNVSTFLFFLLCYLCFSYLLVVNSILEAYFCKSHIQLYHLLNSECLLNIYYNCIPFFKLLSVYSLYL